MVTDLAGLERPSRAVRSSKWEAVVEAARACELGKAVLVSCDPAHASRELNALRSYLKRRGIDGFSTGRAAGGIWIAPVVPVKSGKGK